MITDVWKYRGKSKSLLSPFDVVIWMTDGWPL
ncbi:IS1 family transposase [Shigella sonnei]